MTLFLNRRIFKLTLGGWPCVGACFSFGSGMHCLAVRTMTAKRPYDRSSRTAFDRKIFKLALGGWPCVGGSLSLGSGMHCFAVCTMAAGGSKAGCTSASRSAKRRPACRLPPQTPQCPPPLAAQQAARPVSKKVEGAMSQDMHAKLCMTTINLLRVVLPAAHAIAALGLL